MVILILSKTAIAVELCSTPLREDTSRCIHFLSAMAQDVTTSVSHCQGGNPRRNEAICSDQMKCSNFYSIPPRFFVQRFFLMPTKESIHPELFQVVYLVGKNPGKCLSDCIEKGSFKLNRHRAFIVLFRVGLFQGLIF